MEMFIVVMIVNLGWFEFIYDFLVILGGIMVKYDWIINGEFYSMINLLYVWLG